jgi:hypothetical protein
MNVCGPRQDYRGAYSAVIMKMLDGLIPLKRPCIDRDARVCEPVSFSSALKVEVTPPNSSH